MDGRGRCIDNVFVERLWRSLKYEEVFLHAYDDMREAKAGIGAKAARNSTSGARTCAHSVLYVHSPVSLVSATMAEPF